jgi:hypothetical protein
MRDRSHVGSEGGRLPFNIDRWIVPILPTARPPRMMPNMFALTLLS